MQCLSTYTYSNRADQPPCAMRAGQTAASTGNARSRAARCPCMLRKHAAHTSRRARCPSSWRLALLPHTLCVLITQSHTHTHTHTQNNRRV
jgi:hypothetical protein